MTITANIVPFEQVFGLDGKPLDNGKIYIGTPDQDPQYNQVQVYWDAAGTITAAQPIRTVAGYISYNGAPARIYVNGNYSLRVSTKNDQQVYYVPDYLMTGNQDALTAITGIAQIATYAILRAYAGAATLVYVTGRSNYFDRANGTFAVDASDTTSPDNDGTIIVDTLGRRWKRQGAHLTPEMFGAKADGINDDAPAINKANQATSGVVKFAPNRTYRVVPALAKTDEAGSNLATIEMLSNRAYICEGGKATIKIADNVSTDATPVRMSMFFSNQVLSNIRFDGLIMDMNGLNNKISPNRGSLSFNRFTNAQILFSGTPSGNAARGSDVVINNCEFVNNAGVTCIGLAQTNTVGATLGRGWKITNNRFYNVGLDTDDHSSVFGWATDVFVQGNTFENPLPYNSTTKTGGLVAYEIHGSDTRFVCNTIKNYYQGLWASINLTEDRTVNTVVSGNTAYVTSCFIDFYSANLGTGPSSESLIEGVDIYGNTITMLPDNIADQIKVFFKIAARRMPTRVSIYGNICRNFTTNKSTCLVSIPVIPDQLATADQIKIFDNTAAGIQTGLICYFGGTTSKNIGRVEFYDNSLGFLIAPPDGLLPNHDIYLYGPNDGKIESIKVAGLEHPTKPILTDSNVNGRARVSGTALIDAVVTWSGVGIGNGSFNKKIAIDTDTGTLKAIFGFAAGSTTTYSGNVQPTIAGITSDSVAGASVSHVKGGLAITYAGLVFTTSNAVSIYQSNGSLLDSSQLAVTSYLQVNTDIPCRYIDI